MRPCLVLERARTAHACCQCAAAAAAAVVAGIHKLEKEAMDAIQLRWKQRVDVAKMFAGPVISAALRVLTAGIPIF